MKEKAIHKKFIIAGERRSGTSTLAKWLEVHPDIYLYPSLDKAFFLDDELRGRLEWLDGKVDVNQWNEEHEIAEYERLFAAAMPGHRVVGEKSADYFFWEPCLDRIHENLEDVQIALTLRHPVERAWSHYWNEVGKGREGLSFEDAIEAEEARSRNSDYAKLHLSYIARGKYIESLERWIDKFPQNQLHILVLENLIANPQDELRSLFRFLDVDDSKGLDRVGIQFNHNWTTIPRNFWTKHKLTVLIEGQINRVIKRASKTLFRDPYQRRKYGPVFERLTRVTKKDMQMESVTRHKLLVLFEPYTERLERLTGLNLESWRV